LKRAKIEAIAMKLRMARPRNRSPYVETDARQMTLAPSALSLVDQARNFYQQQRAEVIQRMRHPSTPLRNPAATVVLIGETDLGLRREAYAAQQAAVRARLRAGAFVETLHHYVPNADSPHKSTLSDQSHFSPSVP
jgi:hypothetical protein